MKTVVVLGYVRTGSSLTAAILHNLGVKMGSEKDMKKGKYFNKFGCYENLEFINLNRKIYFDLGYKSNWVGVKWSKIPDKKKLIKLKKKYDSEIKRIIKKYEAEIWGWKHHGTAPLLPLYKPYLKNPYFIIIKRNPESIVKSIQKKLQKPNLKVYILALLETPFLWNFKSFISGLKKFLNKNIEGKKETKEDIIKYIKDYYKAIEKNTKNDKRLILHYENIIKNPEESINRIIKFLKINPSKKQKQKALNFINPNLKNF